MRSTVLGGEVIAELKRVGSTNQWQKEVYVFAGTGRIAVQLTDINYPQNSQIRWLYQNPITGNMRGTIVWSELDLFGLDVGNFNQTPPAEYNGSEILYPVNGDPTDLSGGCTYNGAPFSCDSIESFVESGSAIPSELDPFQHVPGFFFENIGLGIFIVSDIFTNNTGAVWGQPPGTKAEGWRIFEGGLIFLSPTLRNQLQKDNSYDLNKLLDNAQKILDDENISEDCKELIGEENLEKFKELRKKFEKDPKNLNVPGNVAARTNPSGNVFINPWTAEWNPDYQTALSTPDKKASKQYKKYVENFNKKVDAYQKLLKKSGVNSYQYAVAGIIHEFLHQIGVFEPDSGSESLENQRRVIDACIKQTKIELKP